MAARCTYNIAMGANLCVSGAGVCNSIYHIIDKKIRDEEITTLEVFNLAAGIFFFTNAAVSARTAQSFISECQNNTLTEFKDKLQSNNQRRMFTKALKESMRTKGVDVGRAEMIQGLHKIDNPSEFFAVLKQNNRMFNREGVRFTVGPNGHIQMNEGLLIDSTQFSSLSSSERTSLVTTAPRKPSRQTPRTLVEQVTSTSVARPFSRFTLSTFAIFTHPEVRQLVMDILEPSGELVRETILGFVEYLTNNSTTDIIEHLQEVFRSSEMATFQFVVEYIRQEFGNAIYRQSELLHLSLQEQFDQVIANFGNFSALKQDEFLCFMLEKFRSWVNDKYIDFMTEVKMIERAAQKSVENACSKCQGVFYTQL